MQRRNVIGQFDTNWIVKKADSHMICTNGKWKDFKQTTVVPIHNLFLPTQSKFQNSNFLEFIGIKFESNLFKTFFQCFRMLLRFKTRIVCPILKFNLGPGSTCSPCSTISKIITVREVYFFIDKFLLPNLRALNKMTVAVKNPFVLLGLKIIEIEGKFCTYLAFIWLLRASLFAWTNLLSTYSLIIHHLCVQKITKIQNYIKKYLMRTKSLFDYDHEGTKNNKKWHIQLYAGLLEKGTVSFKTNYCAFQIWIKIFRLYPNAVFKHAACLGLLVPKALAS